MRAIILALIVISCSGAQAHSEIDSTSLGEAWLLTPLVLSAVWFLLGWSIVRTRAHCSRGELDRKLLWFGAGWLSIAASLLSPLHEWGERSFMMHMIEHEILMLVAAPLLALSRPLGIFLWALPASARAALVTASRQRWFARSWAWLTRPLTATLLQAIALWLWHAPKLFDLALNGAGWHALQHVSLLGSATLFWWSMIHSSRDGTATVAAAFYLFITSTQSALLGALMSLAVSPWYPAYVQIGLNGPMLGGLTPMEDQQLAGLIMWVPGGTVHAGAALVFLMRWLRPQSRPMTSSMLAVFCVVCVSFLSIETVHARELRICADPNNLPYSNEARQGFENKIIEMVAKDMDSTVSYVWWAQRRGNVRNTLKAGLCDVIPGVASSLDMLETTQPYYRSSYMFVTRKDRHLQIDSFDDPKLRDLIIGVQMVGDDFANTPPAHALTRRGIVGNVRGYMLYGNYAKQTPTRDIVDAVTHKKIDVAIVWGPQAGYFSREQRRVLELKQVEPSDDASLPMQFSISMGVRKGNHELRNELNAELARRDAEIRSVLKSYGVPTL